MFVSLSKRFLLILVSSIFVSFSAIGSVFAAVDGPKVEWDWSMWGKRRALTEHLEKMTELVAKETNGNFTLKLHYGGALSPAKENIDNIKLGSIQGALACAPYTPGKLPAAMVLSLPFLPIFTFEQMERVHNAVYAHPYIQKEFKRWRAKVIMTSLVPPYELMGKGKPPTNIMTDWEGRRLRALGGMGDAMKRVGATPTSMPSPEVYTSLERGLVDGVAFPNTYAFSAFRLHEISDWRTTNMSLGGLACPVVVNAKAWKALPNQYQKLITDSVRASLNAQAASYKATDDKNIPLFKEKGIVAITYPMADRNKFVEKTARPVWDEWVKKASSKGIPAQELLDLVLKTAAM